MLSRFSVAIIVIVCINFACADVYLSPAGQGVWNGSCGLGSCSSANAPCDLPASAVVVAELKCIVHLVAFDYAKPNGGPGVLEIAQKSSATNITFIFQAGSDDSVVNHLALTVGAETVQFSGKVADSQITVDFVMAKTVTVQDLVANQTQFFFSGAQPLRLIPSVSVKNSKFSLTGTNASTNGLSYVFNSIITATEGVTSRTIKSFSVDNSLIFLTPSFSGLLKLSDGAPLPLIDINGGTNISQATSIISFSKLEPMKISLNNANVQVTGRVFDPLFAIDPISFDSSVSKLSLKLSESTMKGPVGGFAQLLDGDACVDIDFTSAELSNVVINCNSPESTNPKDRCSWSTWATNFTDSRICVLGQPSDKVTMYSVQFIAHKPLIAPLMYWFRDITITGVEIVMQTVEPSAALSSADDAVASVAFLLSNKITFAYAHNSLVVKGIVMDTGAELIVNQVTFSGETTLRAGSVISQFGISRFTFNSPVKFSGEGEVKLPYSTFVASASTLAGQPMITSDPNVTVSVSTTQIWFAGNGVALQWSEALLGLAPQPDQVFNLVDNLQFSSAIGAGPFRVTEASYPFYIWGSQGRCDDICFAMKFGLTSPPAVGPPPTAPPPITIAPPPTATAPVSAPKSSPVSAPKFSPATAPTPVSTVPTVAPSNPMGTPSTTTPFELPPTRGGNCFGQAPSGFQCEQSRWVHTGTWNVDFVVKITSDVSPIYANGDISFGSRGSIYFIGPGAGLYSSGCIRSASDYSIYLDYSTGWPKGRNEWIQPAIVLLGRPSCTYFGEYIPFSWIRPGSCKSATIEPRSYREAFGLIVNFKINSGTCNLALGLGIGLGALALVIVAIIAVVVWKRFLAKREEDNGSYYMSLIN